MFRFGSFGIYVFITTSLFYIIVEDQFGVLGFVLIFLLQTSLREWLELRPIAE